MRLHRRNKTARLKPLLERLEDRSMLSASFGQMPHGDIGPAVEQAGGVAASHFGEPSAYTASRQDFSGAGMQEVFVAKPESRASDLRWSPGPVRGQFPAGPAMPFERMYQPAHVGPAIVDNRFPAPVGTYGPLVDMHSFILIFEPNEPLVVSGRPSNPNPSPISNPINPRNSNITGLAVPNSQSIGNELSGLPPIVSQETGSATALLTTAFSATARDFVFQDYAPQGLLAGATSSYERANFATSAAERAPVEVLDGLIHPYDGPIVDNGVDSTDAVAREREAVDEVLRSLHDVEPTLPATATNDAAAAADQALAGQLSDTQIDLQMETLSDEAPAGVVDGGMVLLQATGDANDSGFDLTAVPDTSRVEQFVEQPAIEATVEIYQAVDVAVDETPAAENRIEPPGSMAAPQYEIQMEVPLPGQRERSSSRKAAAVIGATTALTGALVWMNRTSRQEGKSVSIEQEGRERR